jgi:hypothetical protein
MKNESLILLIFPFVLLTASCSEQNKVSGGTIEDGNAVSVEQVNNWYAFGLDLNESAYKQIDGGKLAVLDDGSGARAECFADSASLAMTVQIANETAITTMKSNKLIGACDSIFMAFKTNCIDTLNADFYSISQGCKGDAFDAACRVDTMAGYFENILIAEFSTAATKLCSEMAKNAQVSVGLYEITSSASIDSESSSSQDKRDSTICENCNNTVLDTTIIIDSSHTLGNYILQYSTDLKEISFDNHVIAYNGSLSRDCIEYVEHTAGIDMPAMALKSMPVETDSGDISNCFPMTSKIMEKNLLAKTCRYYMVVADNGGQSTALVLTNIADGELEITNVMLGGDCKISDAIIPVLFLIEDCENGISYENMQVVYKNFKGEALTCEEGSAISKVNSYGEWFNERLFKE